MKFWNGEKQFCTDIQHVNLLIHVKAQRFTVRQRICLICDISVRCQRVKILHRNSVFRYVAKRTQSFHKNPLVKPQCTCSPDCWPRWFCHIVPTLFRLSLVPDSARRFWHTQKKKFFPFSVQSHLGRHTDLNSFGAKGKSPEWQWGLLIRQTDLVTGKSTNPPTLFSASEDCLILHWGSDEWDDTN